MGAGGDKKDELGTLVRILQAVYLVVKVFMNLCLLMSDLIYFKLLLPSPHVFIQHSELNGRIALP